MAHFCWMCERSRPNEAFSGRGHRDHVCRECEGLPTGEKGRCRALIHMQGMLEQSRISPKNVRHLRSLLSSPAADVVEWAAVLIEIARVHPGRRRRLGRLKSHPELWARMHRLGIVEHFLDEAADEPGARPDDAPRYE